MSRQRLMLGDLDLARASGLEIGPRSSPLVRRPGADVRYVDYTTTEELRAAQFDPSIKVDEIMPVDIVWGERPLSEQVERPVDYIAASHVIEHVPDVIGWLHELRDTIRDGGVLGLAIPDMRRTFDRARPLSTVGEALEAYYRKARKPTMRQVFDACAYASLDDEGRPTRESVRGGFALVEALGRKDLYFDAHCWVFTPDSFVDFAEQLSWLGLFPYEIADMPPTPPEAGEFFVRLTPSGDDQAIAGSIAHARKALGLATGPATPVDGPPAPEEAEPLRRQVEALQADRAALLASTSWRLTAPLRALGRILGR